MLSWIMANGLQIMGVLAAVDYALIKLLPDGNGIKSALVGLGNLLHGIAGVDSQITNSIPK